MLPPSSDDEDERFIEHLLSISHHTDWPSHHALPNETLYAIFAHLSPPTLVALSQVSRRFNAIAERTLYDSVSILDHIGRREDESLSIPWRTLSCCRAILVRPQLADSVRRLSFRWSHHTKARSSPSSSSPNAPGLNPDQFGMGIPEALGVINRVLSLCRSLDSLELNLGPVNIIISHDHHSYNVIETILSHPTPIHLPHLSHLALSTDTPQRYTHFLSDFLTCSAKVKSLRLGDCSDGITIPPWSPEFSQSVTWPLASLQNFRGFPHVAAALVPHRPVSHLALIGNDDGITHDILSRLALSSSTLRILDLSAISVRPGLLMAVSKHLGHQLESIKVKLALRHTLHYAMSGIRMLSGLSAVLSAFTRLEHLDLAPTAANAGSGFSSSDKHEEGLLCNEWSKTCPSLVSITFPSRNEWAVEGQGLWTCIITA